MEEISSRVVYLIEKYLSEELDEKEAAELELWKKESAFNSQFFNKLTDTGYIKNVVAEHTRNDLEKDIWDRVEKIIGRDQFADSQGAEDSRTIRIWPRFIAAASVILAIGLAAYFLFTKGHKSPVDHNTTIVSKINDVAPGKTKAVLTLADGHKIVLDSAANGSLAQQGSAVIVNKNGELIYTNNNSAPYKNIYNTLSTSKGEIYTTTLSDGSRIWLNSGSSIRYPVVFTGNERKVEITGEAYFEVAHNPARPFIVTVNDLQVQVLGTHFNINSYSDEPVMKTTLLEGLVKVSVSGQSKFLQPGQQAQVSHEKQITLQNNANIDEVMAWKNGWFYFDHSDVSVVARQLSRWYNVETVYEGAKPTIDFSGRIERDLTLSEVVQILEKIGLRFRIEGRKLIIMQ